MKSSGAISGLGINAGIYLLETLGLNQKDDEIAGPEFTYIGVFLGGLAFKGRINSSIDLVTLCLSSLRPIHSQAIESDLAALDVLARSAFCEYFKAVKSWPSSEEREQSAVTLCQILAERLRRFSGVELTVFQKAKLRPKLAEQFEILELAYSEIFPFGKIELTSLSSDLSVIFDEKKRILTEFSDGDITASEYQVRLDEVVQKELAIYFSKKEIRGQRKDFWKNRTVLLALASAFFLGAAIGPWLHSVFFGYGSAEECLLDAKHSWAAGACYDLYPSVRK